jgi:hypothetical protein
VALAQPAQQAEDREDLANRMAEKSLDILLEDGFLILAGIEDL